MTIAATERQPLRWYRCVLATLVLLAVVTGFVRGQQHAQHAAAAPNPYLNVIGSGPELQNVTVVNLYWDANWDADQTAAGTSTLSKTVLDYLTRSIIGSSYFGSIGQYSNAGPVAWGGGFLPDSRCGLTPNVDHIATYFDVGDFVECERGTNTLPSAPTGGVVLYNVLLPPGYTANFAQNLGPITLDIGNCSGGGWSGYHFNYPPPPLSTDVYFTAIPTSAECRGNSLDATAQSLSHEMVEAITDPSPPFHGWRHFFSCIWTPFGSICGLNAADWPRSLTQGEAADLCEAGGDFATAPVPFSFAAPVAPYTFTGVHVAPYFSNQLGGCVPSQPLSFSAMPAPVAGSITPTSGLPTGGTPITIHGSGFLGATAVAFVDGSNAPVNASGFTAVTDTTIQATTPPGTDGHTVSVRVTNLAGTSPDSQGNRFLYTFPCTVALQVQPASPAPLGTVPVVSATTSHCPAAAEFQFTMIDGNGLPYVLQPWSASASLTWPFVLDVPRTLALSVQVRAAGQTTVLASDSTSYTLTNPCPSVQLSLTPTQPAIGTAVSVIARAPGCPQPEFLFQETAPGGRSTLLHDWSATASVFQAFTPRDAGTYTVTVQVRPGGIATDPLAQASASFTITVADAPAPTGLHQISSTRTAVTVGWTSPALSTITTFQAVIQVDPSDPNSWDTVVLHASDAGFSSRTATFSALSPGTSYTVMVAACDAAGSCSWSAPLTVTTAAGPPGPHPPPCGPRTCM